MGKVWTWGRTNHVGLAQGAMLGRARELRHFEGVCTPEPGPIDGLQGWGKGTVTSVACGLNYTVCVTAPWTGPGEDDWDAEQERLAYEREMRRQEKVMAEIQKAAQERREAAQERRELIELLNTEHPICQQCADTPPFTGCPGFEAHEFKPLECRHCTHERRIHVFLRKVENNKLTLDMLRANAQIFTGVYFSDSDEGDGGGEKGPCRARQGEEEGRPEEATSSHPRAASFWRQQGDSCC